MLLFNIKYNCYVVVELKVTELNSNHTGQIQKYMNYVDENIKTFKENKTIGIIICKQDNKYVEAVKSFAKTENAEVISLCAKIEEELTKLEKEERDMFKEELGISEEQVKMIIN